MTNSTTKLATLFLALSVTLSVSAVHAADQTGSRRASATASLAAPISPAQRGDAIAQFVRKWGPYVEQTYGLDVHTWARRMVPQFAKGDAANIRRALGRGTYEGALAELNGTGYRLSDKQVITRLAGTSSVSVGGVPTADLLGDSELDLVYTPISPCRIVDSRNVPGGAIAANTSNDYIAWGLSDYTSQGGSASDCGLSLEAPNAVVINVTAVLPSAAGYLTVYPYGTTKPLAASVNYVAGAIVNNSVTSKLAPGLTVKDFSIYSLRSSDVVVDVVGFYDAPHATPLDCVNATAAISMAANSTGSATATCAAGFTASGGGCDSNGTVAADAVIVAAPSGTNGFTCTTANSSASPRTGTAHAFCCRVPGR